MSDEIRFITNPTDLKFDPYDCNDEPEHGITLASIFDDELMRTLYLSFKCRNSHYRPIGGGDSIKDPWITPVSNPWFFLRPDIVKWAKAIRRDIPTSPQDMWTARDEYDSNGICTYCRECLEPDAFPYIAGALWREGKWPNHLRTESLGELRYTINGLVPSRFKQGSFFLCKGCRQMLELSEEDRIALDQYCSEECRAKSLRLNPITVRSRRILFASDLE